ncbi:hypothetical protein GCM10009632_42820 [Mycolicibacterium alvei]|uniref:Uncharacterized protein n=2 Tax=Mycolicibacterium alvei TaxID=67081 RepID=A0A6N4USX2_9MYCO|nr:hypothetical protein MALV_17460 [Mycolicibacterium alvei]
MCSETVVAIIPANKGRDMGNRANFVIVENGEWQLYYSHWAGCRMLDALAFGPEFALRYVKALEALPRTDWTCPLWSDGGAVIDVDRKRLLFFGDELMCDMPIRRAMFVVLIAMWPDYEVGWAYGGTHELASYVGADCKWDDDLRGPDLKLARKHGTGPCQVVSMIDTAGHLRLWPLWWGVSSARHGSGLMELLPGKGFARLRLGQIPVGGVHIDAGRRRIGVWYTDEPQNVFHRLPHLWAGWQTECWDDRYEEHAARCGGALRLPTLDLAEGVVSGRDWIHKRVFESFEDSPAGAILRIASLVSPLAPGLQVSAEAVTGAPARPTPAQWRRFEDACSRVSLYIESS